MTDKPGKAIIIGCGFAGLSAASFMAKAGWQVTVLEKHKTAGGRARVLEKDGFIFDMGPSWYWMPDVFERYFAQFGKKIEDYYSLTRLDPSYRIYWPDSITDVPADYAQFRSLLESMEPGAGARLDDFLKEAEFKYKIGIEELVYKPGLSVTEFFEWNILKGALRLDIFTSIKKHIHKYFRHPKIRQMLEFPILFLGALPENTPALYSLMNYADIIGGTWYPQGGMYSVVKAMVSLAEELGVQFHYGQNVRSILLEGTTAKKVITENTFYEADVVIGSADYQFIENNLLPTSHRSYTNNYWNKRTMAPSCLLYYVGLNKKLENIIHHSLFFDVPFEQHAKEIHSVAKWPSNPMFYVSAASCTDSSVVPEGYTSLVFLIPVAAGLEEDSESLRRNYFDMIVKRFEQHTGQIISSSIISFSNFGPSDFVNEYNSFKGNAYGLANTLMQTAVFRPSCRSRKVSNLFFTGQLTVPGPGVPPSLISGEVVAGEVIRSFGKFAPRENFVGYGE
jgi:phytoene desaturase